jgi:phosphate transport system permease protein
MKKKHHNRIEEGLPLRHAKEVRFEYYGKIAVMLAVLLLAILLSNLLTPGISGLQQHMVRLDVSLIDAQNNTARKVTRNSLYNIFNDVKDRRDKKALGKLLAPHAEDYMQRGINASSKQAYSTKINLPLSSNADLWFKAGAPQDKHLDYGLNEKQALWLAKLKRRGAISKEFNTSFFTESDSRDPEKAGFAGSMVGSVYIIIVCLLVALPLGVSAAVYMEEFAKPSRLKDIIEVNINNLAAVPSIIYGLLGLFVFLNLFGLPRSSPLVGGLTLSLMILPVIIISTRLALNAVPNTLRDAARALGASRWQVVLHHVLPIALPGIMTGTILGIARAAGETAPLLMIGMVAFIANAPEAITDPSTAMPVQIYLWAGSPENGFVEKTASGILVLIGLLLCLNLIAAYIRNKFQTRW